MLSYGIVGKDIVLVKNPLAYIETYSALICEGALFLRGGRLREVRFSFVWSRVIRNDTSLCVCVFFFFLRLWRGAVIAGRAPQ